ncbi:MAG TPA: uracil-DNA glycosylase [Bacteroidales bacterium]|mgnify:CR=1 FL=1|nr:uracil-DNA glycosylase [Bacteroidales bacterium]OQC58405.1 MAG: Uracil-DNA glycosylase [Bacteroidetes bacterium ADurb.Bin013]MBP8999784.1 uracil-DNA glycosylase [Bacteroidales bacterium]MCZ2317284.1 uracil-DNA glycosylase [Bacteroidales bacterium]NLZ08986.1 uracil-DNA glycosylase [Bacteroidales bacterium]
MDVKIEASWKNVLQPEFSKPYFEGIASFLHDEIRQGKTIYPPGKLIFNAFALTPFHALKVVLLGQDPYHQPGQAHGLSFSVPVTMPQPPSLQTIFTEMRSDLGISTPRHGCLEGWARQGVLLLNAILTVEAGKPASHSKTGWMDFTDAVIRTVSDQKDHVVFLLWGNFARSKRGLIDTSRHCILEAAHPSPLARGAFLGSKPFSATNMYLASKCIQPVDWRL